MKLVVWLKGLRGRVCLKALLDAGKDVRAVCVQPAEHANWYREVRELCAEHSLDFIDAPDPNDIELLERLASYEADLFLLTGYGRIFGEAPISAPKCMCLNLHGGRLPDMQGSSPMNWALIKGHESISISIIRVALGVDAGDVLVERSLDVDDGTTIADLHAWANDQFPVMLLEAIDMVAAGETGRKQDTSGSAYYPMRFPSDGRVFFDMFTAREIHNRVRALTHPYPGVYTFWRGRKVMIYGSRLHTRDYFGEPGRIYQKKDGSLLVGARDKCLWLDVAELEDGSSLYAHVERYESLDTVSSLAEALCLKLGN